MTSKMSNKQHAQKMIRILTKAAQIVNKGWTRGAEARAPGRDYDGMFEETEVTDSDACRFCAVGAVKRSMFLIDKSTDFSLFTDINERLFDEVKKTPSAQNSSGDCAESVENYNDYYAKDKRYIVRLFNRTIETLKKVK